MKRRPTTLILSRNQERVAVEQMGFAENRFFPSSFQVVVEENQHRIFQPGLGMMGESEMEEGR